MCKDTDLKTLILFNLGGFVYEIYSNGKLVRRVYTTLDVQRVMYEYENTYVDFVEDLL